MLAEYSYSTKTHLVVTNTNNKTDTLLDLSLSYSLIPKDGMDEDL